ncbi:MAG: sugar transporter substrate-binding protein [Clostridia bacterium]|jgi:ribose transport system substrate-binding protein|nr:sugar transporter substrate-binding protein [Clostridia bacterium]
MNVVRNIVKFLYGHAILIMTLLIVFASLILFWLQKEDIKTYISKPQYHFYFIAQNSVDPFWNEVMKGVEKSGKDHNVVVEFNVPRFNNPEEELKFMDIAVISKVDGIITHVPNGIDYTAAIDKAYDKGIPVVTVENDDSESKRYAFVGTNSFELGKEAARLLIEATKGKANVAVISNSDLEEDSIEHNLKMNGFLSILKNYPEINIVDSYTSRMGILSAEEITQNIIESKEEINAIFTFSSADTLGSAQLIVDRNKVGSIILVGYGNSEEIIRYIDKEIIYGTVASDPYKMGYESVKTLIDVKNGNSAPTFIDTEVKILTKRNINDIKSLTE